MKQELPTSGLHENLRFTTSGQVWADFLLSGINYGLRSPKEKEQVRLLHQALYRALPGESLLLGVCSTLDPHQVVERMLKGVDPEDCPDWVEECEATLDTVEMLRPGQRVYWLSVPLSNARGGIQASLKAARDNLELLLGLPASAPPAAYLKTLKAKSTQIQQAIPAPFHPTPTTPAQAAWLHQHMLDRGLFADGLLPESTQGTRPKRRSALDRPLLDEGGTTDDSKKVLVNPLKRRYLKVQSPAPHDEDTASYQSMLVVSDVPDGELPFPGGEILGRIDECGLAVDWAMRMTVRGSAEVLRSNQRALETLNEQFNQREGELSHGLSALDQAAEDLSEYASVMESNKLEVECQATIVVSVAAPDAESTRAQAKGLASWFADSGYKVAQPLGYQRELWWQMHPGTPTSPLMREYAQITTSETLSLLVPFATAHVGDSSGTLLAININNGPMLDEHTPCGSSPLIFHNPDGATDKNVSGSTAFIGDLGSGKSFALKKEGGAICDRGGRIIVTDRTDRGEWAEWASALRDARIIDVSAPEWSMDPLRVFDDLDVGARVAQSFLTPLLNVAPTSEQGVLLSEALEVKYLHAHGISSLGELVDHLADGCTMPGALELARLIRVFANKDLGRVVFDASLPPLDLTSRALIFRTHQLALPKRAELEHEHLFRQLSIEKLFGRALFALISLIAKAECFRDRDQLAAFVVDEAHAVTLSPEGVASLVDFVRDGRKHRAVVYLGSHDPDEDFPSETLRGLIPWRILMRHKDATLARNGLRWLDLDPTDDELVELITKETSPEVGDEVPAHRRGECLIRDSSGAVGRGRILPPALTARDQAARTGGKLDVAA